jgi:ketosteroid isomerase-like protein
MSQQNVELLYRAFDSFNRRDLEAFLAFCSPGVEFISLLMQVEGGGSYRGHDGVRTWWGRLLDFSPDLSTDVDEARGRGDMTLARVRAHGHAVDSNAPVEVTYWHLAKWRRKKVIWWCFVASKAEALEAAGLSG